MKGLFGLVMPSCLMYFSVHLESLPGKGGEWGGDRASHLV